MGLSTSEKEGCRQILQHLDCSDLLSLYETVMKAKTTVRDRAELIDRIIEESKTASELLNRKKVYRDIILQYLNKERIFMYAKSTKQEAIQKSIEHWKKTDIPITVESEAAKNSLSCSLQLHSTVSDTDVGQLTVQINGLSIHSNKADKAESLTMRDAQRSMTGAKPKGKTASTISQSTTLSFTVTAVTSVSEEKMRHRTKKH